MGRARIAACIGVVLTLIVPGSAYAQSERNAGDGNLQGQQDRPPCALDDEPINDDGSLRKPSKLLELEREHEVVPRDRAVRAKLAAEYVRLAKYFMYCSTAPPYRKYPLAYCLYQRAQSLDRRNREASDSARTIRSIYKSLGKPVPVCGAP